MMSGRGMIFLAMGIECVVAVLGGFWIGNRFDAYLGGRGLGGAIGLFVCMIGWIVHLFQVAKKIEREDELDQKMDSDSQDGKTGSHDQ